MSMDYRKLIYDNLKSSKAFENFNNRYKSIKDNVTKEDFENLYKDIGEGNEIKDLRFTVDSTLKTLVISFLGEVFDGDKINILSDNKEVYIEYTDNTISLNSHFKDIYIPPKEIAYINFETKVVKKYDSVAEFVKADILLNQVIKQLKKESVELFNEIELWEDNVGSFSFMKEALKDENLLEGFSGFTLFIEAVKSLISKYEGKVYSLFVKVLKEKKQCFKENEALLDDLKVNNFISLFKNGSKIQNTLWKNIDGNFEGFTLETEYPIDGEKAQENSELETFEKSENKTFDYKIITPDSQTFD